MGAITRTLFNVRVTVINNSTEGAVFWFVYKAHPPVHIGICTGGWYAVNGPKHKKAAALFLAGTPIQR